MRRRRPYFAVHRLVPSGAERTLALGAALAAARRSGAGVASDRDVFRSRPAGPQGLLSEVVGEVSGRVEGSLLEGYAGVRRPAFTLIAAVVAAALFWELSALLAKWLSLYEHVETNVTWQPLAGAAVLFVLVVAGIAVLVQADRSAVDLLDAMTAAVPPVAPLVAGKVAEPTPPPADPETSSRSRRASSAAPARAAARKSPPASPPV